MLSWALTAAPSWELRLQPGVYGFSGQTVGPLRGPALGSGWASSSGLHEPSETLWSQMAWV